MFQHFGSAVAAVLLVTSGVIATPFEVTVSPPESEITMELCMTIPAGERCDSDSASVQGWATVSLDCLTNPTTITIHDFHFWLSEDIDLHLVWTLGRYDATASDLQVFYTGEPLPPTTMSPGGGFTYAGVPVEAGGDFTYEATGTVCIYMGLIPLPCSGIWDIGDLPIGPMDATGIVQVDGRNVTVTLDVDLYAPILPELPGLGGMSVTGTVVGHGPVPLPDVPTFVGVLLGDITELDLVCESDINADGNVDGLDIQPYVESVLGS